MLADLANDIVEHGVGREVLSVKGFRPTHGRYSAGRYAALPRAGAWIGLDHQSWRRWGRSRLWAAFAPNEWGRGVAVAQALSSWLKADPPRACLWDDGGVAVPLLLLPGVERNRVIDAAVEQLAEIDSQLSAAGLEPLATAPPDGPSGNLAGA